MSLLEPDYVDRISRSVYEEIALALQEPSGEIAREALNIPIAVAGRAVQLRALNLSGRMLRLFTAGSRALLESENKARDSLLDWGLLRLSEYGRGFVEPVLEQGERERANLVFGRDAFVQLFRTYAELAKAFVDHDPAEARWLNELNQYWDEYFRHRRSLQIDGAWQVDALARRYGPASNEVRTARANAAAARELAAVEDEIVQWRAANRLALCMWVARNLRRTSDIHWAEAWAGFAGYFGSLDSALKTLDFAIRESFEDRAPWSQWVLDQLPRRATYGIAVENELAQAFTILALNLIEPDQPLFEVDPLEWAASAFDNAAALVDGVLAEASFRALLPEDRLGERRDALVQTMEEVRRQRDRVRDDQLIARELDEHRVAEFERLVRDSWAKRRLIRAMFVGAGEYEEIAGRPESDGFAVQDWQSKSFFVEDPGAGGLDLIAENMTEELARGEASQFLAALADAPRADARETPPADALAGELAELRTDGLEPTAVLLPWDWELTEALGVESSAASGGFAAPAPWVPDEEASSFRGWVQGLPAFSLDVIEDRTALIVALPELATWRQWTIDDRADRLLVTVKTFTEPEAGEIVERDATAELSDADREERVRRILKAVNVRLFEYFAIDIHNPRAARWITFPPRVDP